VYGWSAKEKLCGGRVVHPQRVGAPVSETPVMKCDPQSDACSVAPEQTRCIDDVRKCIDAWAGELRQR